VTGDTVTGKAATDETVTEVAGAQVPPPGELTLDHISHFVPDRDAASDALERLGFTLTPFSEQSHRLEADGPLVPAGTGNRCIMFERGYLEFLTPFGDSPIADQLRAAMRRYVGIHLVAFGTASPDTDYQRLSREGFNPLYPVALQRPIGTETGEDTARFTVVRVPPDAMPEGRIQYCAQLTPDLVWQKRWIGHANGAVELAAVTLCVDDPAAAAARYARFTGLDTTECGPWRMLQTRRGRLFFGAAATVQRELGLSAPAMPWMAAYTLRVRDLAATQAHLRQAGIETRDYRAGRCLVELPSSLGGAIVFAAADSPDAP
jgi:hypothetical protein